MSRPRLLDALNEAALRPLTLVAAGPGAGKTALLSEWAGQHAGTVVWASLEPRDCTPNRFVTTLRRAFEMAGTPLLGAGQLGAGSLAEAFTAMLEAADFDLPLTLVLDDAHVITDRAMLDAIDMWQRRWNEYIHIVLAARNDPALPLHRYRLAGTIAELRAADLAMTREEAQQLLDAHGVRLPARQLDLLTARTEGWTAGLRLSAIRMSGTERAGDFVTEFALDEGSAGEYLVDEVLAQQPPAVRALLIETSFLTTVDGGIAEAVTGQQGAGDMLAALSRENSFVLALDGAGTTFRYHALFAEVLQYLLRREPEAHRRDLMRRAAQWYLAGDDIVNVIRIAVLAEDWRYLARMLSRGGFVDVILHRAPLDEIPAQRILEQLRGNDDPERVVIEVAACALFAAAGATQRARRLLDALGEDVKAEPAVETTVHLVRLLIARARHRVRDADDTVRHLLDADVGTVRGGLAAAVRYERAMTHFYAGAHAGVEGELRAAATEAAEAGLAALELDCVAQLAHVNAFWARFRTSAGDDQRASELLRGNPDLTAPAALLLAAAHRALVQGQFPAATKAIRRAEMLPIEQRDHDLRLEITLVRAALSINSGRYDDARDALRDAPTVPRGPTDDHRVATLANIDIREGRPDRALQILESAAANPPASIICLARGTAYLALGDPEHAEAALRPVLTGSSVPATRAMLVAALVLHARILQVSGDPDARAAEQLVRALELSDGEIVLPFVRTYELLKDVIVHHPLLAAQWPTAPEQVAEHKREPDSVLLSDPLTEKEHAVLRWLATSLTTTEIAAELGLSVNTVKTHIAAIYRKLAAARRRDAVLRARRLELL